MVGTRDYHNLHSFLATFYLFILQAYSQMSQNPQTIKPSGKKSKMDYT